MLDPGFLILDNPASSISFYSSSNVFAGIVLPESGQARPVTDGGRAGTKTDHGSPQSRLFFFQQLFQPSFVKLSFELADMVNEQGSVQMINLVL